MFEVIIAIWHLYIVPESISIAADTWETLNRPFVLTLIGTSVAAFAGVLGAHTITERHRRRDQLVAELRAVNSAIMTAFSICNSSIALKDQHTKELREDFHEEKQQFEQFMEKVKGGKAPAKPHDLKCDFRSLVDLPIPGEALVAKVHEHISPPARAYALADYLCLSINSLNDVIRHRNGLIQDWKTASAGRPEVANTKLLPAFYFGTQDQHGGTDQTYSGTVDGIYSYNNDCIYFAATLCDDLRQHGLAIQKRGYRLPVQLFEANFDGAIEKGLMPDPADYQDWSQAFETRPKLGFWKRLQKRFAAENEE